MASFLRSSRIWRHLRKLFHGAFARRRSGLQKSIASHHRAVPEPGDNYAPNAGLRQEFITFDELREGRFPLLGRGFLLNIKAGGPPPPFPGEVSAKLMEGGLLARGADPHRPFGPLPPQAGEEKKRSVRLLRFL